MKLSTREVRAHYQRWLEEEGLQSTLQTVFKGTTPQRKLLGLLFLCSPFFPIGILIFYISWRQSSDSIEYAEKLMEQAESADPIWAAILPTDDLMSRGLNGIGSYSRARIVIGSFETKGVERLAELYASLFPSSSKDTQSANSARILNYLHEQNVSLNEWTELPEDLNAEDDIRVAHVLVRNEFLTIHPEFGYWGYFMVPAAKGPTVHIPGSVAHGPEGVTWGNYLLSIRDGLWPLAENDIRISPEDAEEKIDELDSLFRDLGLEEKEESDRYRQEYTGSWIALAIRANKVDELQRLIEQGAPIDVSIPPETFLGIPEYLSPLALAAANGHLKIAQLLIADGANVNQAEALHNFTPLYLAVAFNHVEVVRYLLQQNANPNVATFEGSTPLLLAIDNENLRLTEMLLNAKADPNTGFEGDRCSEDHKGLTPVVIAASLGNSEILKALSRAGADVDVQIATGLNALLCAVLKGQYEAVQALVMAGVDVNAVADSEKSSPFTALDLATDSGKADIAQYLERHGAVSAKS